MSTPPNGWTDELIEVGGTSIQLVKGGTGEPLLLLHGEMGHLGVLRFHQALAEHHTVYIPSHPGFGKSPRLDWIMNMRDLAAWYLQALDELGLDQVNVIGFSLGGWLAAEMATMCTHQFKKMVLISPMGVLPPDGEIFDMFMVVSKYYISKSVYDAASTPEFQQVCPDEPTPDHVDEWETAKEQASRLGWKPYMYEPSLPHLLGRLKSLPTLIVGGKQDAIVPLSVAEAYRESIAGARLELFENCGHLPELEKPDDLVHLVHRFLWDA